MTDGGGHRLLGAATGHRHIRTALLLLSRLRPATVTLIHPMTSQHDPGGLAMRPVGIGCLVGELGRGTLRRKQAAPVAEPGGGEQVLSVAGRAEEWDI